MYQSRLRWSVQCVVLGIALGYLIPIAKAADELEKQLQKVAPEVLKTLREKEFTNVGTLKFRVKKGNQPATDRAGELNKRLADKLELALVVANPIKNPIGIIHNANKVAATISGASHLTEEGRKKLFVAEYPLAWGNKNVVPDAFLTGVAAISPDLKSMTVVVAVFDKSGKEMEKLAQFDLKPDLEDLLDSGESFSVRGVFDQANLEKTDDERKDKATEVAVLSSLEVKSETANVKKATQSKIHPLSPGNPSALVTLDVLYDEKPQKIEFRDGTAFVVEPTERQKVAFVVRRTGVDRSRLGVVLKVNGENTLYRQKLADAQCAPWVFEPNRTEFGVYGFQMDGSTAQEFKVLSQAESAAKEIDYGEFVGTISISVFGEQKFPPKTSPKQLLADDGEDFAMLTRGVFPEKSAANLAALKAQLAHSASSSATRGLIVQGANIDLKVNTVAFKADSVPLMTATVRYYNPQDLPQ